LNTKNKTILQLQARQKKWYGHGRTGRTADYGLAASIKHSVPDWVKPSFVIFDIRAL